MIRTEGKSKERKSLGKNFKGKVAALKKQHKKDMKELTELAMVIKKRKGAHISGIGGGMKDGTGPKTGVKLRYYNPTDL